MGFLRLAHLQSLTFYRADRQFKRHCSASTAGTPPLTTPVCPPAFLAGGCPSRVAMAAAPAPSGSMPPRRGTWPGRRVYPARPVSLTAPSRLAAQPSHTRTVCRHSTASKRKWQGSPYRSPLRINSITCGCISNSCGRRYARHKRSSHPELFASIEHNSTRLKRTALHFKRSEGGVKPMFPLCS